MAKNNSLAYIKRFLNTLDVEKKHDSEESSYYEIEGVKIRLSNHSKKLTKEADRHDLNIIQPVNSSQYIVTVRSSLAMMVLDLKGVKELISNYLLLKRMDAFKVSKESVEEKTEELLDYLKSTKLKSASPYKFGMYLNAKYGWYSESRMSDCCKKYFKRRIAEKFSSVTDMDEFLSGDFSKKVDAMKSKRLSKNDMVKLLAD